MSSLESGESSRSLSPSPERASVSVEQADAPRVPPKETAAAAVPSLPSLQGRLDALHSRIHQKKALLAEIEMNRQAQALQEEELQLDSMLAAAAPAKKRKRQAEALEHVSRRSQTSSHRRYEQPRTPSEGSPTGLQPVPKASMTPRRRKGKVELQPGSMWQQQSRPASSKSQRPQPEPAPVHPHRARQKRRKQRGRKRPRKGDRRRREGKARWMQHPTRQVWQNPQHPWNEARSSQQDVWQERSWEAGWDQPQPPQGPPPPQMLAGRQHRSLSPSPAVSSRQGSPRRKKRWEINDHSYRQPLPRESGNAIACRLEMEATTTDNQQW